MAKMIPEHYDKDTKSAAERKLFHLFERMPDTENWCVLHSVAIARHSTQSQGECDFVIIIPDHGTFVLEVKGGGILCQDGIWFSRDRYDVLHQIKNPVSEANNAMQSLRTYVEKHNDSRLQLSLWGFGVVFPDASVHGRIEYPDLDDLQIADVDDLIDMRSYLLRLAGYWRSRKTPNVFLPNKQQADEILSLLRPNHEFKMSVASQIRSVERQTLILTDNQRDVFEGLLDNERCLVRGSAGTGKTVLAVECARHWLSKGMRVGLFCYNRQLASWLKEHTADDHGLVCDSLTEYVEKTVSDRLTDEMLQLRQNDSNAYYSKLLPSIFCERLIDLQPEGFECIILDEAQDLFDEPMLDAIDMMLKDGLDNGNWYFFMDAEKQNLYHAKMNFDEIRQILRSRHVHCANYVLMDNCRNSPAIIKQLDAVFGTKTRCRNAENKGADVGIFSYHRERNQADKLNQIISKLVKDDVDLGDIVLLSTVRYNKSCARELTGIPVSTDRTNRKGQLLFSTVHSFKGLESPVVILVDFDTIDYEDQKHLLYVGMTRARSALYILLSDKARRTMDAMIQEGKYNE